MSDNNRPEFGKEISELKIVQSNSITLDDLPLKESINTDSAISAASIDSHYSQKAVRKRDKEKLLAEVELEEITRSTYQMFEVITQQLIREQSKKKRAFQIGIFTVFLVVTVITMLKSVVDSSPILFVRIGQQAVGAIDFQLMASEEDTSTDDGNINYYAIDPFNDPFKVKRDPDWKFPNADVTNPSSTNKIQQAKQKMTETIVIS